MKQQPITIMAHIEIRHQGNIAKFADKYGTTRQTVYNWIADGASWYDGKVWLSR